MNQSATGIFAPGARRLFPALLPAIAFLGGLTANASASDVPRAIPKATASPTPTITVRLYTGEQDPNCSTGETYLRFFTPETGAVLSEVTPVAGGTNAALEIGGLFSAFPDAVLIGLTQPTGQALLGTFKAGVGGITAKDNVALLLGDLTVSNEVTAVAQTGTPLPGLPTGVTIRSFMSLDGNGNDPFFLVTLQGTGITAANSLAVCSFAPAGADNNIVPAKSKALISGSGLNVLVQKGQSVTSGSSTKIVKTITTLVGSQGTLADGRWRCDYFETIDTLVPQISGFPGLVQNWIGVRLTFTDGSEGIYAIPSTASGPDDWILLLNTSFSWFVERLGEATFSSFGLPCFGEDDFATLVTLDQIVEDSNESTPAATGTGGVTVSSSNNIALLAGEEEDDPELIARKGDAVTFDANDNPLTGVKISGFSDPVIGEDNSVAFMITMSGLPANANKGIMYAPFADVPFLIANIGAAAPGGGHWASFISLVMQTDEEFLLEKPAESPAGVPTDDPGPIFVGTLKISGSDGVDATNNLGLWAVDGLGNLDLLLRTGQQVTVNEVAKTIKTFVALAAAPGSVGAASGYDTEFGDVAVVATFTDGSEALLNIAIPDIFEVP